MTAQKFSLSTGSQGCVSGTDRDLSNLRTAADGGNLIMLPVGVGTSRSTTIMT